MTLPSGVLVAAPRSGAGKTTVMLGLLRCLSEDGVAVQPFKCGPDYIDPAFHTAACGRPSFNLDSWSMGGGMLAGMLGQANGAEMVVAEGSMGLFDGVASKGETGIGASADIAALAGWPVVLVLDVSGQAQSAAATALGFAKYRDDVNLAGVILNRVASPRHDRLARTGMEALGIKVLGSLPRRGDLAIPERHLGLVQAFEHPDLAKALDDYAAFLREHVDIAAIRAAAKAKPVQSSGGAGLPKPPGQRIALAQDAAFSFVYPHILAHWRAAGAEVLPFAPLKNEAPDQGADIVWLPGGYPELHAGALAAADQFRAGMQVHAETRPVHGECGGYMALGAGLVDKDGARHQMLGLLGLETSYAKRKMHLGYRQAALIADMPGIQAGAILRGHEFHYSTILAQPDAPLAEVRDATGAVVPETGSKRGHITGSFFHLISSGGTA